MVRNLRRLAIASCLAAGPVAAADPALIQSFVDQIDAQNIRTHVEALGYERSDPTTQTQAANYIQQTLIGYGYDPFFDPVATSENVIARIEGSENPDIVFVLGAHFDTVPGSPGADDNGSGVGALLEVARVLAGSNPRYTIEFAAFALEEVGKLGSEQRAQDLANAGVGIRGMISFDMVAFTCSTPGCQIPFSPIPNCLGVDAPNGQNGTGIIVGGNQASAPLRDRLLQARDLYAPSLETIGIEVAGDGTCEPGTRRSDHASFWDFGYQALVLTDGAETRNSNYHQPGDTIDTLDYSLAERVSKATIALIVEDTFPTGTFVGPELELNFLGDRLSWTPAANAIGYDLIRGSMFRLDLSGGAFNSSVESCLLDDTIFTSYQVTQVPAPSRVIFFLVRAVFADGAGSWNSDGPGEQESRDDEIAQSPGACP